MASNELRPGTQLRHRDGAMVTLDRRKTAGDNHHGLPFIPGWWVRESGGLADVVIDAEDGQWTVVNRRAEIVREFASVVNRYSLENESNTQDFVLGEFLMASIEAYNEAVKYRERMAQASMKKSVRPVEDTQ